MTPLLLVLAFSLLLTPILETLWEPLWTHLVASTEDPTRRLRLLSMRMTSGLALSALLALGLLWRVYHAPRSHPLLPEGLVTCLGHDMAHGPDLFTVAFLLLSTLGLGLLLVALFYPVPSFPRGRPRPDLAQLLERRGVQASVELLPAEEPACWSELTPTPRVVLLGGIEKALPPDQLAAVLDHEAGHLALGDHRARIWARAYRRLLFFFGGATSLFDAFVHEQERRADDQALAWDPAQREPLSRALYSLATHDFPTPPSDRWASATPLGALGHAAWSIKQRLSRLRGQSEEVPPGRPATLSPFLGLGALLLVVASDPGACTLHCLIDSLP